MEGSEVKAVLNTATGVFHMLNTNFQLILCEDRNQPLVNIAMHT